METSYWLVTSLPLCVWHLFSCSLSLSLSIGGLFLSLISHFKYSSSVQVLVQVFLNWHSLFTNQSCGSHWFASQILEISNLLRQSFLFWISLFYISTKLGGNIWWIQVTSVLVSMRDIYRRLSPTSEKGAGWLSGDRETPARRNLFNPEHRKRGRGRERGAPPERGIRDRNILFINMARTISIQT